MRSLLKEPFIQFIVLGALLFVGNARWEQHVRKSAYTISVDPAEMERQAVIFASENRRQPTDDDLSALLFAYVEEEALLREAQRMGLGEDDTIIRRRLAQKMRFLIEDTTELPLPSEAKLQEWFEQNHSQFLEPEKRSFSHIYLSPEKHGDQLQAKADQVRAQITDANWKSLGDPFMLNRAYDLIDATALERLLGASFTKSVFALDTGEWSAPIESAFGLHVVKVDQVIPKTLPDFETIKGTVAATWQDSTKRAQNNQRLRDLIGKYEVVVEDGK